MSRRSPSRASARPSSRHPTRSSSRAGPEAYAGTHEITTGAADLLPDRDDPDGWVVHVNGVPSSYVQLADPTVLAFEYVRWIGDLLDVAARPAEPLRVAHLGGAGCTLARYVAATRPGSPQVVYEVDAALVEMLRSALPLRRRDGFRLRVSDAREGLAGLGDGVQDVVIRDAFLHDEVPEHLATVEFGAEVRRVLAPGGLYVANIADRADQSLARAEAATLRAVFDSVALVAEPSQLRGRRYGNVLLLASEGALPLEAWARRLASGAVRARVVLPERVAELVAGLQPTYDG